MGNQFFLVYFIVKNAIVLARYCRYAAMHSSVPISSFSLITNVKTVMQRFLTLCLCFLGTYRDAVILCVASQGLAACLAEADGYPETCFLFFDRSARRK